MSIFPPENTTVDSFSWSLLPLDWTRIQPGGGQFCCDDPTNCQDRRHPATFQVPGMTQPVLLLEGSVMILHGYAVFCLHETDPSWFQGYFIPDNSRRPWRLLAVQEEVEECLACTDGGFRRLTLTIYPPMEDTTTTKTPIHLNMVDWTGGDMIKLRHERINMEADRLWTGKSSLVHVQRYFQGLILKLRKEYEVEESSTILEWLPDVAVVVGKMNLVVPNVSENQQQSDSES